MKHFDDGNVYYLEDSDFNGNTLDVPGKVVIMIQSLGCGHCTTAKPAFSQAAGTVDGVKWCTIESDTAGEKLNNIVNKMPGFRGFPHYVGYKDGRLIGTFEGGRDVESLKKFAKSL
jgi:thioredoxin-like negative regulator of GroEL